MDRKGEEQEMDKPYKSRCDWCGRELHLLACGNSKGGTYCSTNCANLAEEITLVGKEFFEKESKFNEPEHYHKHSIDTIGFLQQGFPPEVFKGFAIGSAIKYLHRFEYKNGLEDLIKARDYIDRLIEIRKKDS